MIPSKQSKITPADVWSGVKNAVVLQPADVGASAVATVVVLLSLALGGGPVWLALALLVLTLGNLGRLSVSSVRGVRDARDFIVYLDGLDMSEWADVETDAASG